MTTLQGRSVFIVETPALMRALGSQGIADRSARAHVASVWIRTGHGTELEPGLTDQLALDLKGKLQSRGIALWGWHVPWCADDAAVIREVQLLEQLSTRMSLDGMIIDAERTTHPQRFQGGAAEAGQLTRELSQALARIGKGFAFSSHDQPNLHRELPLAEFLSVPAPALPQVYNHDTRPGRRLDKSEAAYRPLLGASFQQRFMPTANGSMKGNGAFPTTKDCVTSASRFLDLVQARAYPGHSFWCWEEMPHELWALLEARAV